MILEGFKTFEEIAIFVFEVLLRFSEREKVIAFN
jgi:hypothetical protein